MENIELRNLYINKIQKQLSKTINSVNLLQQLQNVINQSGGSIGDIDQKKQEAREMLNIDRSGKSFGIVSGISYRDNRLQELEGALSELEKLMENLRTELKNKSGSNEEDKIKIKELEETKLKLEEEIANLKKEKEESDKNLAKMKTDLEEYNKLLEELKKLIPKFENTDVMNFNEGVDRYINTITGNTPPNTTYKDSINTKILEKYNNIFTKKSSEIEKLKNELTKSKITEDDLTKKGLSNELLTKGLELNTDDKQKLKELIEAKNTQLSPFIQEGTLYGEIAEFNKMKDVALLVRSQSSGRTLFDSYKVKNEYFGFVDEDFQ
jgi:hypothetical protein